MEKVTFVIENKKDVSLLISIAGKLGIKKYFVSKTIANPGENNFEALFKTIDSGVDISTFGDPSLWQRETRKDRSFNHGSE